MSALPLSQLYGLPGLPDALLWRIGTKENADHALGSHQRWRPANATFSDAILRDLPGLNIRDLMLLPIERLRIFFDELKLSPALEEGCGMLLDEIRSRLRYLTEVGLGYLNLDRQSRHFPAEKFSVLT